MPTWNADFDLILGNETSWDRPWLGEITGAKISTRSMGLDLLSSQDLDAPLLANPIALNARLSMDTLLNFGAFVFVGILSFACFRQRNPILPALAWAPISLAAESLQIFIVGRTPSVSDFILNVSGALVGGFVYWAILKEAVSGPLGDEVAGAPK